MNTVKTAIRLTVNSEVESALRIAKRRYPTLSDAEILKLGLSKIVYEENKKADAEKKAIMLGASGSVGHDYLTDTDEDIYDASNGSLVSLT
jgi:hypothetical protein